MVISVFPDYGQAIDRYRSTRSERLERQAQETQRAAYNRLLGQVQDPTTRQAMSGMDPETGTALFAQQRTRSQQAEAEALTAQQEQAQRFQTEVMFPALQEAASAYQGMEGDERTQFASNLTRRLNIQAQAYGGRGQAAPESIEQMLAGYAPEQPEYNNPQKGVNPATGREEFFVTDERGQPRFIGVQGPPSSRAPGFRIITRADGTTEIIHGDGEGVYGGSPRAEAQLNLAGLEGVGDLGRVRSFTADVWSLPAQAFGVSGRTLETAVRAAEQAAGASGLVSAFLSGDTSGFSQQAVQRANEAFETATGMSLQQYTSLRSQGTFLVGRLLPIVTGDTRFTEMERMITETASGVRNLDDVFGSQSAARGASEAVYGVGLQGQAVRAIAAGSEPPYPALRSLDLDNPSEAQVQAINQFVDDLVQDGMRVEDARAMARRVVPIYASHLSQISQYNSNTLRGMAQTLSEASGG